MSKFAVGDEVVYVGSGYCFDVGDLLKVFKVHEDPNSSSAYLVGMSEMTASTFCDESCLRSLEEHDTVQNTQLDLFDNEDVPQPDVIEKPAHYNQGGVECIDYIAQQLSEEQLKGYLLGNLHKYTHRWQYKGGYEDLKKAQWYLNRLIATGEPNA